MLRPRPARPPCRPCRPPSRPPCLPPSRPPCLTLATVVHRPPPRRPRRGTSPSPILAPTMPALTQRAPQVTKRSRCWATRRRCSPRMPLGRRPATTLRRNRRARPPFRRCAPFRRVPTLSSRPPDRPGAGSPVGPLPLTTIAPSSPDGPASVRPEPDRESVPRVHDRLLSLRRPHPHRRSASRAASRPAPKHLQELVRL